MGSAGKWALAVWLAASAARGADGRVLVGRSGVHVEDHAAAATQAAQQAAEKDLLRQIGGLAEELTGRALPPRQCWREYQWLVQQPGVRKDFCRSQELKDYGTVVTGTYRMELPDAVLARWNARLEQAHRSWLGLCLLAGVGTAGGWLVGFVLLALLDRWTLGYRRGLLAGVAVVIGLTLTGSVWLWIFATCY